jgi:2-oxoisovalerate dehydrogenase E1 component alpha subunit
MTHPISTVHPGAIAADDDLAQVLDAEGERHSDPTLDPYIADVDAELLRGLFTDMSVVRRLDREGVALQRQGQLALWAPCLGQEAAQIGTGRALHAADFVFPSYREHGLAWVRGAAPVDLIRVWRGEENSSWDPAALRMAPPQIIIGAQTLHAVGYAMGIQRDAALERDGTASDASPIDAAEREISVAYFGDGASSQGDVHEAMVFASSFRAPVVFVCQNNQWAISEPVGVQARRPLAGRAPGYGIPSLRVDGNDVLACLGAMRWAADHARSGRGPAYIEAVTYRMGPHTTADDPTRYRRDAEVERWGHRDPILRVERHLRAQGAFDDDFAADVGARCDALAGAVREAALTYRSRAPLAVFDDVYAEPHTAIARERAHFAAYLDGFADAAPDGEDAR